MNNKPKTLNDILAACDKKFDDPPCILGAKIRAFLTQAIKEAFEAVRVGEFNGGMGMTEYNMGFDAAVTEQDEKWNKFFNSPDHDR